MRVSRWACLAVVVVLATATLPPAYACGALEEHMREAARVNTARLPLYAELTQGRSKPISRRLILLERLGIPVAKIIDFQARKFQAAGVPIISEDVVSMEGIHDFTDTVDVEPLPLELYEPVDARSLSKRIRRALKNDGFAGVEHVVEQELARLEGLPCYHAMVRHLLESIRRMAHLAPKHEARALSLGLKSTRALSARLVKLHCMLLGQSSTLDEMAAPLQAEGVPILLHDLPPIPLDSDFYPEH